MVTLALLDPLDVTTVLQWWCFEDKTEITIGRSARNDIVIRDPRISRHHVLLAKLPFPADREEWQLTNQGKNDVFLNGLITFRAIVPHGGEIQLVPNGPKLCFFLSDQLTAAALIRGKSRHPSTIPQGTIPQDDRAAPHHIAPRYIPPPPLMSGLVLTDPQSLQDTWHSKIDTKILPEGVQQPPCQHGHNNPQHLFCSTCGYPISVLGSIRHYDLLKVLSQGEDPYTFLGWINPQRSESPVMFHSATVVLKQLNLQMARDTKEQELFMRQAMTLNQLNHPTIPQFLDFFAEAHQFCLVMEWIPGQNLESLVRERGHLTPAQTIACGLQICGVLEYLQGQTPALVHRDIKPANLIVRYRDGRIVLVDFGVVKPLIGLAQTRLALGGYRAPEQLHGQTFSQSDFFGLGATLLYLLTGQDPARIHRYEAHPTQYYLEQVPGIPVALAESLGRLLQPNPHDRYGVVEAVKKSLKLAQDSLSSDW